MAPIPDVEFSFAVFKSTTFKRFSFYSKKSDECKYIPLLHYDPRVLGIEAKVYLSTFETL